MKFTSAHIPATVFPSDNPDGVPLLDPALQADFLDVPLLQWGTRCRSKTFRGTWGFYVEDYRFSALWANPQTVINTACNAVIEPNFTIENHTPRALAIYQIYRKRHLARLWQSLAGIRVWVDLNVPERYSRESLLGVPRGWTAYATRGYCDLLERLDAQLEQARTHAGGERVLFLVYGGGRAVRDWAEANAAASALWQPEQQDRAQRRKLAASTAAHNTGAPVTISQLVGALSATQSAC